MIPRIKTLKAMDNFLLAVEFDDGHKVIYDVKEDIETLPTFRALKEVYGLFNKYNWTVAAPASIGTMKSTLPAIQSTNTG